MPSSDAFDYGNIENDLLKVAEALNPYKATGRCFCENRDSVTGCTHHKGISCKNPATSQKTSDGRSRDKGD